MYLKCLLTRVVSNNDLKATSCPCEVQSDVLYAPMQWQQIRPAGNWETGTLKLLLFPMVYLPTFSDSKA